MEQRDQAQTEQHARLRNFRSMRRREPKRPGTCCVCLEGTPKNKLKLLFDAWILDSHFMSIFALNMQPFSIIVAKNKLFQTMLYEQIRSKKTHDGCQKS